MAYAQTGWRALGFSLDAGTSGAMDKCAGLAKSGDTSKAAVKGYARCGADAFCASYGVPPDVCESVAGPIADSVVEFFDGLFGGGGLDCSHYSPVLVKGLPADPCAPCALVFYTQHYGMWRGPAMQAADCAAYVTQKKLRAGDVVAKNVCLALANEFEQRMHNAANAAEERLVAEMETATGKHMDDCQRWRLIQSFRARVIYSVRPTPPAAIIADATVAGACAGHKWDLNPDACTAANQGAAAMKTMLANIDTVANQILTNAKRAPVIQTGLSLKPPAPAVPVWAWLALAGAAGAVGYGVWKRYRR